MGPTLLPDTTRNSTKINIHNFFIGNLQWYLPIDLNPCIAKIVGRYQQNYISVYTDRILDEIYKKKIKKKQCNDVKVFTGNFTNEIKEGFKLESPYNNVSSSPEYYIALLNEKINSLMWT